MKVFVTGASGYIGEAVTRALISRGDTVRGLVGSVASRERLRAAGVVAQVGDLRRPGGYLDQVEWADAVVHAALVGGLSRVETQDGKFTYATVHSHVPAAPAADRAAVEAMLARMEQTGKPFIYTSGAIRYASRSPQPVPVSDDGEDSAGAELALARLDTDDYVLARSGIRTVSIRPHLVYGRGGGLVAILAAWARATGAAPYVDEGDAVWSAVHVDDLADLYVLALDGAPPGSAYVAAAGPPDSIRTIASALALSLFGRECTRSWSQTEAARWISFADYLVLHVNIRADRALRELDWRPTRPTLVEEIRAGGYR